MPLSYIQGFDHIKGYHTSSIPQRMVRIAVAAVEEELGFEEVPPNEPAMASLTRALVMDHACRSNYDPCIAAAFDMFYDGNAEEPTV